MKLVTVLYRFLDDFVDENVLQCCYRISKLICQQDYESMEWLLHRLVRVHQGFFNREQELAESTLQEPVGHYPTLKIQQLAFMAIDQSDEEINDAYRTYYYFLVELCDSALARFINAQDLCKAALQLGMLCLKA